AGKDNTESVIGERRVIRVRENGLLLRGYIIGDVKIRCVRVRVGFVKGCMGLNMNESVVVKKKYDGIRVKNKIGKG
ncbi:hypothetical protein, partial [Staphylococcus epidermidis]|uniref:hypothetical protein n=1 Tax=Staphylococcus epidermidis TaxID=1282 RepID=UPI001C92F408